MIFHVEQFEAERLAEKRAKERAYAKEYRVKNSERLKEQKHKRYVRDRERRIENVRNWGQANPEKVREYKRKWQKANHEQFKAMNRAYYYKRKYGLAMEERDAMLLAQGGACAACGADTPGSKHGWHVDHCHVTGRVRGMLCHHCNAALGNVKDSIKTLYKLAAYLQR